MMKITATAATPYRAVELDPVDDVLTTVVVEVVVDTDVEPGPPGAVTVVVEVVVDTDVDTDVDVDGGWPVRVRATMSPEVVPGHVATASKLQVPTGTRRNSWPLTAAPIDTPWSIGAPM